MTAKSNNPKYVAQDILSRRPNSEFELRQKMAKKGFFKNDIDETVEWLKVKKYLNDEAFARQYIEETIKGKAVGKRYLAFKLQQKKIPSSIIETALAEIVDKETEKALLKKAAESWKKSHPKYAADNMRLTRFLLSRGFPGYLLGEIKDE